jgi:general secretion pathway protein G
MKKQGLLKTMRRTRAGFTFLEILVTILIISILSGVVGLSVIRHLSQARMEAARAQIKTLQTALQIYRSEQGNYPTQEQGLMVLCQKPTTEPIPRTYPEEGYLSSLQPPLDPWKNEYIFLIPGRQGEPFEVLSYGSDGEPGGEKEAADLSSSDR